VTNQLQTCFSVQPELIEARIKYLIQYEYISQPNDTMYVIFNTSYS